MFLCLLLLLSVLLKFDVGMLVMADQRQPSAVCQLPSDKVGGEVRRDDLQHAYQEERDGESQGDIEVQTDWGR